MSHIPTEHPELIVNLNEGIFPLMIHTRHTASHAEVFALIKGRALSLDAFVNALRPHVENEAAAMFLDYVVPQITFPLNDETIAKLTVAFVRNAFSASQEFNVIIQDDVNSDGGVRSIAEGKMAVTKEGKIVLFYDHALGRLEPHHVRQGVVLDDGVPESSQVQ